MSGGTMISSQVIGNALVNGVTAYGVDYAFPRALEVPEAGHKGGKGMRAFKTATASAGASVVNNMLGVSGYLPVSQYPTLRNSLGDGLVFAAIEAGRSKGHRTGKRVGMNIFYGAGISAIASQVVSPVVSPYMPMVPDIPASPIVQANMSPGTTSPGFST